MVFLQKLCDALHVGFTISANLLSDFDVRSIWPKFFDFLSSCPQTDFGEEHLLTVAGG